MTPITTIVIATVAVAAFSLGRLSAAPAIRHLSEALAWSERLGGLTQGAGVSDGLALRRPEPQAQPPLTPPVEPLAPADLRPGPSVYDRETPAAGTPQVTAREQRLEDYRFRAAQRRTAPPLCGYPIPEYGACEMAAGHGGDHAGAGPRPAAPRSERPLDDYRARHRQTVAQMADEAGIPRDLISSFGFPRFDLPPLPPLDIPPISLDDRPPAHMAAPRPRPWRRHPRKDPK